MTIEQKKIALINWITNIDDEAVLDKMVGLQQLSLSELPDAIVQLLQMADLEPEEELTTHTSVRDILKRRRCAGHKQRRRPSKRLRISFLSFGTIR